MVALTALAVVDCKSYSKRVDVKHVEAAIGMAADVSADIALIVTTVGYSEAALARAISLEPALSVQFCREFMLGMHEREFASLMGGLRKAGLPD